MTWMYDNPATLDYSKIDEPIRQLCKKINESSWLRTEESCCGHYGYTEIMSSAWYNSTPLYLRLVVLDEKNLTKFFQLYEQIGEGHGKMLGWHHQLTFDRIDDDGIHWFFHLHYDADIKNRSIAIDLVLRTFMEFNEMLELMK